MKACLLSLYLLLLSYQTPVFLGAWGREVASLGQGRDALLGFGAGPLWPRRWRGTGCLYPLSRGLPGAAPAMALVAAPPVHHSHAPETVPFSRSNRERRKRPACGVGHGGGGRQHPALQEQVRRDRSLRGRARGAAGKGTLEPLGPYFTVLVGAKWAATFWV